MNYSPWPDADEGKAHNDLTNTKRWRFEWKRATWMLARPWYGQHGTRYELRELTMLFPITFWFPFISYRGPKFHGYLGWKWIPPHLDPAFLFTKLDMFDATGKTLYVQLGGRMGAGEIS